MNKESVVSKFHQFVKVEKGPVNTALIDLLKGQVYQIENSVIEAFEQGRYDDIPDFVAPAREMELLIDVEKTTWIPSCGEPDDSHVPDALEKEYNIELHAEQGVDLETVMDKLKYHYIYRVVFYGEKIPKNSFRATIVRKEKDQKKCASRTCVDGNFEPITEDIYMFNMESNSCWGEKVAVTADGKVRPCIHSAIEVGDIATDNIDDILEKLESYWAITKKKVKKCKDCELKYVCFDCRELAYREGGELLSPHAGCKYDPYKGTWRE